MLLLVQRPVVVTGLSRAGLRRAVGLRPSARAVSTEVNDDDRPPLVLIHGMHCTGAHWEGWRLRCEEAGLLAVVPTLEHHEGYFANGDCTPPPQELGEKTLDAYADEIAALVATLPKAPVFVGHSMGGLISLKLLERGVGCGAALIAPACPSNWTSPLTPEQLMIWHGVVLGWPFQRPIRLGPFLANFGFFNRLPRGSPERTFAEENLVYESGRAALEMLWSPLAWLFNGGTTSTAKVDAAKISQPVAVYGGTDDRATPARHHRRIVQRLAHIDVPYTVYDDHGHWLVSEPGWEKVCDDVIGWVRTADLRPPAGEPAGS